VSTLFKHLQAIRRLPQFRIAMLLLAAFTLNACGPHVVNMQALDEFPAALVDPLPIATAVHFTPEFTTFTHKEKRPGPSGQEWTINLGHPQIQAFRSVLHSAFRALHELPQPTGAPAGAQAIIVPRVAEFQFALPADTRAKVFEIWIKYDLEIRDAAGEPLGHWNFTAYGKTPTAVLTSDEDAIRAATVVALRDAGASLLIGLQRDPQIRMWLGLTQG
jgi:hypothetical protein